MLKHYRTFIFCAIITASFEIRPQNQGSQGKSDHYLKKACISLGATGLALCAHIVSEYFIVSAHEYGHILGSKISGGAPGHIKIDCLLKEHPLAVLFPFKGNVTLGSDSPLTLAAGPLAGLCTTYSFIIAAYLAQAYADGSSYRKAFYQALKKPIALYPQITKKVEQIVAGEQGNEPSFSNIFFNTFIGLKSVRMFGELLYGLTPLSIKDGDGARLWQKFGLRQDLTVTPLVGLGLALTPTCLAAATGMVQGIFKRIQTIKDSEKHRVH